MKREYNSLFYILFISLLAFSISAVVSSAEVNTVLYDGNAAEFATPPDVIAYANTAYEGMLMMTMSSIFIALFVVKRKNQGGHFDE